MTLLDDTDEHRAIRASTDAICQTYDQAYYLDRSRRGLPATEVFRELGRAGMLAPHLSQQYGGAGLGLTETVIVMEQLASHGLPLLTMLISPGICGSVLTAHGSPAQQREWLPRIASGESVMAFGLTEPDAGSNTHAVRTTARRDGDGWRISGGKYYISALDEADAVLLTARDEERSGDGPGALSLFVVPTDAAGLSHTPIDTAIVATDRQATLTLEDVRVGPDALVGTAGNGLRQLFAGLNPERILAAAIANGVARFALARAARYARERAVWGAPIGTHQGIAHPLALCYADVELARLATARAAERADAGRDAAEAANLAKLTAAEAAVAALDQAIQTHGGNGFAREFGLADLWFITRLIRTVPVSREMLLNYVAQHSLGLPKSY